MRLHDNRASLVSRDPSIAQNIINDYCISDCNLSGLSIKGKDKSRLARTFDADLLEGDNKLLEKEGELSYYDQRVVQKCILNSKIFIITQTLNLLQTVPLWLRLQY